MEFVGGLDGVVEGLAEGVGRLGMDYKGARDAGTETDKGE